MSRLSIGQVAKQSGVSVEALRFYEKQGLLPKPARDASGYRRYDTDIVRRVRFIQRAKALGFALREIADLLNLRQTRTTNCAQMQQIALNKMADIEQKRRELQHMCMALAAMAQRCEREGNLSDCPFLDALDATAEE